MDVFVARQPIFDRDRRVYGYELLFRVSPAPNRFDPTPGEQPTKDLISNCLFAVGLDNLAGGKHTFVNFDRAMLLQEWYKSLPPKTTVIELLETVVPDAEIVAACQLLSHQGYRVALDDFVSRPDFEPLLDIVKFVKIEIGSAPRSRQEEMFRDYQARGLKIVSEKVETYEQFEWARKAGCDLFQGYFFARPEVIRGQQIEAIKMKCLGLLREIQAPEIDFDRLAALVSEDVGFSYKLIRYASSALFSRRGRIRSVREGLITLGEENVRRWVALVALTGLAGNKPGELIGCSLIRAKFCELMGPQVRTGIQDQAFLMGLFSLLDALLDRPLDEALAGVRLAPGIAEALLGLAPNDDALSTLYRLACRYEAADWDEVDRLVEQINTPAKAAFQAYSDAVQWANEALAPKGG